ncbi:hypothetical protein TrVE_jg11121 [Triparma verrucosa]|uniref:Centrosomal protein CEP104 N-terminal domain-containing protein n=1 Tax=Triparma verrucosa TaxID=1606542 RepID=A0A9W6ZEY5_9STRA|nr:hypothetical protein TrVE_jg11121 [Triparma verrucosa]
MPPADDVTLTSPWVSDLRCEFPMEIGLELASGALVSSIRLTAHESLTPEKIELFVGVAGEEVEEEDEASQVKLNPYSTALWKRLGFVSFQTGAKFETETRRRETKTVENVNLRCKYLKLIVHEPALTGVECQVGLCDISLFGEDDTIAYRASSAEGLVPSNPDLIVAQALRNLTDSPINLPPGVHEMEAALFDAGVEANIIGTTVISTEARIDEDTLKHINDAKAECKEACVRDDFKSAKLWKERIEGLAEVGKEIWRVREQERAAAMKDDFDLAIIKSNEGKALGSKRDKLREKWAGDRGGEEKKEEVTNHNIGDSSGKWKNEENMRFVYPSIVESKKEFQGIAALERIVRKVEERAEDPVREVLEKIKPVHGAASPELGPVLSKVLNEIVGSRLLGFLLDSQVGSTQMFALNCLSMAVRKRELKTPPSLDRIMINAMTILIEHGMKAEGDVWRKATELMELIFCSPTREAVFETSTVKFSDIRDCLGRLIRSMCVAALFSDNLEDKEESEKFAKATIVSLSRQDYIGYGLMSSLIDDRQGVGYEVKCSNLLISEALIEEYGAKGDSRIDLTDCLNRVGGDLKHVNENVRRGAAGVIRSLMERDILNEKFLRECAEGWALDEGAKAYLAREYARDRARLAEIKAKRLEEEAKEEAAAIAREAEKAKIEAKKAADRLEEDQRWRTEARGKQLFKFVGEVMMRVQSHEKLPEEEKKEGGEGGEGEGGGKGDAGVGDGDENEPEVTPTPTKETSPRTEDEDEDTTDDEDSPRKESPRGAKKSPRKKSPRKESPREAQNDEPVSIPDREATQLANKNELDALANIDTTVHEKKLTPEEEEDERMRLIIEGKVPPEEINAPAESTSEKDPKPEEKKEKTNKSRDEGDFADLDHLTKGNIEDFDKSFPEEEEGEEEKVAKVEEQKKEEEKKVVEEVKEKKEEEVKEKPPMPKKEPEKPKPVAPVAAPDAKKPTVENVVVKKKKGGGCQIS